MPDPARLMETVGAVLSIVTTKAVVEVCVSVSPSMVVVAVERTLYKPGESCAVVHDHAPVVALAVHTAPVLVHVPVVASVSEVELAVATES